MVPAGYAVSDCDSGVFSIDLQGYSVPAHECDQTKLRAPGLVLVPCTFSPFMLTANLRLYGDVVPDRLVNLDDLLCVLNGFSSAANCPAADLFPCFGNGVIDLDVILGIIRDFAGNPSCTYCP